MTTVAVDANDDAQTIRSRMFYLILNIPRPVKKTLMLLGDGLLSVIASVVAIYLRLGYLPEIQGALLFATLFSMTLCWAVFWLGNAYRTLFRHMSAQVVRIIARNILVYAVPYAFIFTYYGVPGVPRTLGLIQPMILGLLILSQRALIGQLVTSLGMARAGITQARVLIYGAGAAGRQLYASLQSTNEISAVAFIDDDATLVGQVIDGVKVYSPTAIEKLIKTKDITDVLLALPSAARVRRNQIIERMGTFGVTVRSLPSMLDLAQGRVEVSELRSVSIDDLLGRARVAPRADMLKRDIEGKVILVTGAGGSIGSELVRQIAQHGPARLILLDHSEFAMYAVHREIEGQVATSGQAIDIVPVLGSVTNERLLRSLFNQWAPDSVYHAAAYKHVPLVEQNVVEAVENNVIGTYRLAMIAKEYGTPNFVLISTDKAVRPTSIMGATKRLAEQVLQAMAANSPQTCFSMVRFGNVLGSSGSVVPLFRRQVHDGGPVTVTDFRMTRYFMLIPEAAQLVIQAGAMATGGEVFVLDMGEPVKIVDLARSIIALSGLTVRDKDNPAGDIEITEVGLRPGEKLYEELLIGENSEPSEHPLIMRARESFVPWDRLNPAILDIERLVRMNDECGTRAALLRLVPEFTGAALVDATPAPAPVLDRIAAG